MSDLSGVRWTVAKLMLRDVRAGVFVATSAKMTENQRTRWADYMPGHAARWEAA